VAKHPKLNDLDAAGTLGMADKAEGQRIAADAAERIAAIQGRLIMEARRSVLVVLQGTDASGKDGAIRAILGALNPMLVRIAGFKKPTPIELAHDFLWRVHAVLPARGEVGVFNRSHYEDILAVRVEKLAPDRVWKARYQSIVDFEAHLVREGTVIRKFMLCVSKDEQLKRLNERRDDPTKRWKYSPGDMERRNRWDEYVDAYQDVLERTSTDDAPWEVIPADHKWVRDARILSVLAETLEGMDLPAAQLPAAG
jgi:PPK2 family polyphosphate:nucleotide phosphotransferase